MNARMLIPSKYFTAADFNGETTVTIDSVSFTEVEVEGKKGQPATTETKGSILLREFPGKPWLCNVTNTKCLIAMFGEDDVEKKWPGKRVAVFHERVMSFGEWVLGVRIKGSPDIAAPVSVRLKLRKKKEQVMNMAVTSAAGAKPANGKLDPNAEMWRDYRAAGLSDPKQFAALRANSTGKAKTADLVPDDIFKFAEALKALTAPPPDDAPPADPEQFPS